jgi:hypothetical protein
MASAHGFPCDRAPAGGGRVARIDPRETRGEIRPTPVPALESSQQGAKP